jgi:hypothetical protein
VVMEPLLAMQSIGLPLASSIAHRVAAANPGWAIRVGGVENERSKSIRGTPLENTVNLAEHFTEVRDRRWLN